MDRYEINKQFNLLNEKVSNITDALLFNDKKKKLLELEKEIIKEDFWSDQAKANSVIKELNLIKEDVNTCESLIKNLENLEELIELSKEDEEALLILEDEFKTFFNTIKKAEERALLSAEYDSSDAILEIHPGAGGTESMDWASMLYRMYHRYSSIKNFKFNVLDYISGDEAGIKSCMVEIKGKNAYGLLKSEIGVHRLVRISPFDSSNRRHTSFASVDVSPVVDDNVDIKIHDDEIRVDTFHSSGAGGQSVNTTDSAIRITHIPTGIVVSCQNERSQIKNKEIALKILKSKLIDLEIKKNKEKLDKLKGEQSQINFGSQIRSYVFCPYTLCKDHRTNYEVSNVFDVLDGNIDDFILEYLKYEKTNQNK